MLPKTSVYVKSYDGQMDVFFWLKIMNYYENIILFGIYKKNLILNLPAIKDLWKPK